MPQLMSQERCHFVASMFHDHVHNTLKAFTVAAERGKYYPKLEEQVVKSQHPQVVETFFGEHMQLGHANL